MAFKVKKFRIRTQIFGAGTKKARVGVLSSRSIKVNGKKVRPGERAANRSALLKKAKGK